ncbi:hypothetical protein LINGRAHAP2_LOCUS36191 [Linum grandiflorum]
MFKKDLGSVIFGCNQDQITEFQEKKLLGTPSDVQSLSISEQQPVKSVSKTSERESVESLTRRMKRAKELGQDLIWDEDGWRMRNYVY